MLIFLVLLCGLFGKNVGLSSGTGFFKFKNPDTDNRVKVYYYKPKGFDAKTPVAIILHGSQRDAKTYRNDWEKLAEEYNFMILVPFFSQHQYHGKNEYNLGNIFEKNGDKNPVKEWSFSVPDRVFAAFKQREITKQPGYTLYGHGGGSQFVTRFAMMMPKNNACHKIAANPGWYTYPKRSIGWPYGIKEATWLSNSQIDNFLREPFTLMLGDNDVISDGGIRDSKGAKAQGKNRKQRGKRFFKYAKHLAKKHDVNFAWKLMHVRYANHSDTEMCPAAARQITSCW